MSLGVLRLLRCVLGLLRRLLLGWLLLRRRVLRRGLLRSVLRRLRVLLRRGVLRGRVLRLLWRIHRLLDVLLLRRLRVDRLLGRRLVLGLPFLGLRRLRRVDGLRRRSHGRLGVGFRLSLRLRLSLLLRVPLLAIRTLYVRWRILTAAARTNPVEHSFSNLTDSQLPSKGRKRRAARYGQSVLQQYLGLTFFQRRDAPVHRLGILPGAFNPPTRAHLALAQAAGHLDEVLFVLPRELPHKRYSGVTFEERLELLLKAVAGEPRFAVAASEGGLFIEIARECREAYGDGTSLSFLCGRDAAERIVSWDYGQPGAFRKMLDEFDMLVASRNGDYTPPPALQHRIHALELGEKCDHIAATEVRERIGQDDSWRELVPPSIAEEVMKLYSRLLA
jgi:nicotinate (nicotinamide) nucleotide adenylyltransferase